MSNFGFRNLNGRAYKVTIEKSFRGVFVDRLAAARMRQHAVSSMNRAGRNAEMIAKSPGHSPYKTGALVNSIKWVNAKRRGFDKLIIGRLTVGVPYGRRQEFEHKTRRLYLHRAIQQALPGFERDLGDKGRLENVFIGRVGDTRGNFG